MENQLDDFIDCARYGDLEEVSQYLDKNELAFNPAAVSASGNTALHYAAANGHLGNKII